MADRLATPLGTKSEVLVSEELLVAQDDIRSIGKSVDTLLMELDQQAFEAYITCLRTLKAQQPTVYDERTRQGVQGSLLNMRPIIALPNRVLKHWNPIALTSRW